MQLIALTLTALLSLAATAPTSKRWPVLSKLITPSAISEYSVSTGAITYNTATGIASKTGDGKDKTTLVTFDIPSGLTGSTCALHFYLDPADSVATVSGTGKVDVYSSLKPAPPYNVPAWGPPGNQRNQHYGRLNVVKGGVATVSGDGPTTVNGFPCPAQGQVGFEIVGVGDQVLVKWSGSLSGAYITY